MSKITIGFIISNLGQGGAEKQFISLITGLNKEIFDVTVYLYACQTEPFFEDLESNVNINYIKSRLTRKNPILKILSAVYNIRQFLKNNKFDIIVSTLFMNNFFVRIAASKLYKNKIIANVRTAFQLYTKFHIIAEKIQIKNSFVVFNNYNIFNEFVNVIHSKYQTRLSVIYNGFNIPKDELRENNDFIFGSLGRFSTEKNILQVVRVFQEFNMYQINTKLIIQGHKGSQYQDIINLIHSENIEIRDENPDVDLFYNSIRILILPSLFEGCPNVLFEALLRKKICIISSGANSDDFIKNGINGFVYDGSDEGLSQAMLSALQILNTPNELKIIKAGYQYAYDNFSITAMVNKYEQLFLKIYEENQSSN
jgi:glycosyltransferase involved in cell wall biosynthesis